MTGTMNFEVKMRLVLLDKIITCKTRFPVSCIPCCVKKKEKKKSLLNDFLKLEKRLMLWLAGGG